MIPDGTFLRAFSFYGGILQRGYVRVFRKVEDSGLLAHPKALALFLYLLLNAAWKPFKHTTRWGIVEIRRGQIVTGRLMLAAKLKQSEQNIRTALKMLAKMEILTIQTTNDFSIITLVNYDKYQTLTSDLTSKVTSASPAPNQRLTTEEEGNKGSIEEKEKEPDFFSPTKPIVWNPLDDLFEILKSENVIVTERPAATLQVIAAKARKQGRELFRQALFFYCRDEFIKTKAGRSLDGFQKAMDRMADLSRDKAPARPKTIRSMDDL